MYCTRRKVWIKASQQSVKVVGKLLFWGLDLAYMFRFLFVT